MVSTETETTFERDSASEITNPNNEISITYEYYKLQQQYDVFTNLYQVDGVIYVSEHVPTPQEVDAQWLRRHDWILSEVLVDESFRDSLNELISDVDQEIDPTPRDADDPYTKMQQEALQSFATFQASAGGTPQAGLTIPDIYATPQQMYQARSREIVERDRANALRTIRRSRLLQHFRDNILFYCKAIWAAEDRDQRWLRYQKERRTVPNEWSTIFRFSGATTSRGFDLSNAKLENTGWTPSGISKRLTDIIDPAV